MDTGQSINNTDGNDIMEVWGQENNLKAFGPITQSDISCQMSTFIKVQYQKILNFKLVGKWGGVE